MITESWAVRGRPSYDGRCYWWLRKDCGWTTNKESRKIFASKQEAQHAATALGVICATLVRITRRPKHPISEVLCIAGEYIREGDLVCIRPNWIVGQPLPVVFRAKPG